MSSPSPKLSPERMQLESRARISISLEHVQRAQDELSSACADLSALCGGSPLWNACHKLTDKVHAFWYRVDRFRAIGRYHLDDMNVDGILRRDAQAAASPRRATVTEGCGGDAVVERGER